MNDCKIHSIVAAVRRVPRVHERHHREAVDSAGHFETGALVAADFCSLPTARVLALATEPLLQSVLPARSGSLSTHKPDHSNPNGHTTSASGIAQRGF